MSGSSFKQLFEFSDDPDDVIIDFKRSRICDHSALEAIDNLTKQYAELGKTLHLLNVSHDCQKLLVQAQNIVEISVIDQPYHYVADNRLG